MSDYCSVGVSAGLSLKLVLCIAASDVRDQRDTTASKRHAMLTSGLDSPDPASAFSQIGLFLINGFNISVIWS